jgi:hypothetical protein
MVRNQVDFTDRLLECDQPASGALGGEATGDRGPASNGREPWKAASPTSHGECLARSTRRSAGLLIEYGGLELLWSFRPAEVSANLVTPKLDPIVFVFALIISLLTGFVFGTIPALRASRTSVAEALKEEARTAGRSRRRITFANVLLVGQVAFSFVSLVTAALFLRSIEQRMGLIRASRHGILPCS